jgi:hypothetical protein
MPRISVRLIAIVLGSAWLFGCASSNSRVRVDQVEGELPNCRTFAWHSIEGDVTSLSDGRVRAAVMQQLEAKGYQESPDKPDCRIAYHLTTREIPQAKPGVGVGVGGGSRGVGGGIGISLPIGQRGGFAGTFTLDVIDAAKNAQVWTGSVDANLREAEISESEAQQLAEVVLGEFPNAPDK